MILYHKTIVNFGTIYVKKISEELKNSNLRTSAKAISLETLTKTNQMTKTTITKEKEVTKLEIKSRDAHTETSMTPQTMTSTMITKYSWIN